MLVDGKVDILVNNAGIVAGEFSWNLKEEQVNSHIQSIKYPKVEKVFKVNTFAPMWLIKGFLPDMMKKNSGIFTKVRK